MNASNIDIVRGIYAQWASGNFASLDWAHPEIEFVQVGGLEPGVWTGREEMAKVWRGFMRAWGSVRSVPDDVQEIDSERVLVLVHNEGEGRVSGIQIDDHRIRRVNLLHLRDGLVTRLVLYWDGERAYEDLGLTA